MVAEEKSARKARQSKVGRVVSDKMNKTIVVSVDRLVEHPLYQKTMRRTSRFMAHDEDNACRIGDKVQIEECRPLSRNKRWMVKKVLERAEG